MTFLELTLADGRKLDVPPFAVFFVEGLDKQSRDDNPGAKSGLFYDVGGIQPRASGGFASGSLQTALVKEPFAKIVKALAKMHPVPRVAVETTAGQPVMLEPNRIVMLAELEGGKCRVTHRVADRILPLDVKQSRDEIRTAMEGKPHGHAPEE